MNRDTGWLKEKRRRGEEGDKERQEAEDSTPMKDTQQVFTCRCRLARSDGKYKLYVGPVDDLKGAWSASGLSRIQSPSFISSLF